MITRKATNKALELADAGMITYRDLATMTLKWMSEDEVASELNKDKEKFVAAISEYIG